MKGIHRTTPDSKRRRQMTTGGGFEFNPARVPQEVRDWNAAVDRRKQLKRAARSTEKAR